MPSSEMDDLFGTAGSRADVPVDATLTASGTPVVQYRSRRELREAEARAALSATANSSAAGPSTEQPAAVADVTPVLLNASSIPALSGVTAGGIQLTPTPVIVTRAERRRMATSPGARKLRRTDVKRMRAAAPKTPKAARKNPASVLATMAVIGGLFAVAGLPAYSLTASQDSAAAEVGPKSSAAARVVADAAQSVEVGSEAPAVASTRDGFEATTADEIAQANRDSVRAANMSRYVASGARELGDDYPWPYELGEEQGGGLSVLNYYYRQCTDFVAWRLNRDAGSYKAPFKWVWSNMTPTGGNASQWKYAWEQHDWTVSDTPIVGSVAWFGSQNHVAYVKQVLANGFVVIEEYNWVQSVYGQRTIPTSSVEAFLYPPT